MDIHGEHPGASELARHAAWLRRLALALVGDAATADDVVQETFVAALTHPPGEGPVPRTWLARVLRNAAKQGFRSAGRRAEREAVSAEPRSLPGPRETVERLDTERCLTEELARLDEPFQTALMLRYYDGLSPAQIAEHTGAPGGTVRWRLQRGLELLRERLDGRFGERSAWCLLLLPIARSQPPMAAGSAASTSILQGVLTMSATWKLGAALACVVAITLGLMLGGVLPTAAPRAHEEPLEVAFRPLAPAPPAAGEEKPLELPADEGSVREAIPGDPPVPAPTAEPSVWSARVEARVVDAAGLPLEGVELRRLDGDGPVAHSAADGRIALDLGIDDQPRGIPLEFRLQHHASHGETPVLVAGQSANLGTVVLGPGGVISGRVLDVSGAGVKGARVAYQTAIETSLELEKQRIPGGFTSVPMTHTDAQGRFALAGLGTGYVRVFAEAPGLLAGFTPPVEVRHGLETFGIELRLDSLPSENGVRGIVLDPEGAPVPHAALEFRHESRTTGTTTIGDGAADAEGRFEFRLPDDARLWLTARDPADRSVTAAVAGVRTGGPELVLRLDRGPRIALAVNGAEGRPIEEYAYSVLSADESSVQQREPRAPRPGGAADFQRPASAFVVAIEAPGHLREVIGPFEPALVATSLEARLVPVPGLRGRVRLGHDGPPAAGARVSLRELVGDDVEYVVDGFHARLEKEALDEVVSDADGAFLLTVRRAGDYVVRAERDACAPAESPEISIGTSLGAPELELVLGTGGTIAGRVRRADGTDPAGTILALTRGDGFGRTLRAGPEGRYEIEHLTPGPWWLEVRSEELIPGNSVVTRSTGHAPRVPREPTCHVFEGETTWHDLAIGGALLCALEGCLRVDGAAAQAWKARLIPHERPFFEDDEGGVALDVDGCFRLETEQPGTYWLVLSGAFEQHGDQVLVDVLEVGPGVARWEHGLSTGALVVDGAAAWTGEEVPVCVHLWDGPGELFAVTVISGNEAGVARVPAIPSGPARLVRPDPTHFDFARWPTLLEVEVPAGGEARVRLP